MLRDLVHQEPVRELVGAGERTDAAITPEQGVDAIDYCLGIGARQQRHATSLKAPSRSNAPCNASCPSHKTPNRASSGIARLEQSRIRIPATARSRPRQFAPLASGRHAEVSPGARPCAFANGSERTASSGAPARGKRPERIRQPVSCAQCAGTDTSCPMTGWANPSISRTAVRTTLVSTVWTPGNAARRCVRYSGARSTRANT